MASLRSTWFPGYIQYQHFFAMFPFNNEMVSFDMTGEEMINVFKEVQYGVRGIFATKGLKETIRIHANGTKQYLNITLYNGTAIDPKRTYRGISLKYLMLGRGHFVSAKSKIYTLRN